MLNSRRSWLRLSASNSKNHFLLFFHQRTIDLSLAYRSNVTSLKTFAWLVHIDDERMWAKREMKSDSQHMFASRPPKSAPETSRVAELAVYSTSFHFLIRKSGTLQDKNNGTMTPSMRKITKIPATSERSDVMCNSIEWGAES